MSKVPLHTVDEEPFDHEDDMWPDADWDDYLLGTHDWSNWDEHPWEWYMEKNIRITEGWIHIATNPTHKDVTVIYWLKSQDALFKYSKNEFLIKDEICATMLALKFG